MEMHILFMHTLGSSVWLPSFLFLPLFISCIQFPNARDFTIYSSCVVDYISSFSLRMVIVLGQPSIILCLPVSFALRHVGPEVIKTFFFQENQEQFDVL